MAKKHFHRKKFRRKRTSHVKKVSSAEIITPAEKERRRQQGEKEMATHNRSLEYIMQDPSSIGLENIYSCFKETEWYKKNYTPGGTPDLIMTDGKLLYILEYKINHNPSAEEKGQKQLKTIGNWFNMKGISYDRMRLMLVYGYPKNFKVVYYAKEQLDKVKL